MKTVPKIIITVVVLLAVAVAIWYFAKPKNLPNGASIANGLSTTTNEVTKSGAAIEKVGTAAGSFGSTNPFNVNVNPYQGYKNPFQ